MTLEAVQETATKIVFEAGMFILRNSKGRIQARVKKDGTRICEIDLKVEKKIFSFLRENFPQDSIIGEENFRWQGKSSFTWLIDPLSNTAGFIKNRKDYAINLALLRKDQPVIGLVYAPDKKELFSARLKNGARLNQKSIKLNTKIVQGKYITHRRCFEKYPELSILGFSKQLHPISAALSVCQSVVDNNVDAFAFRSDKFSLAAAVPIYLEAGGLCCDFEGRKIDFLAMGKEKEYRFLFLRSKKIKRFIVTSLKKHYESKK